MNGSQLLIPSSRLLLTTKLLAVVSIPKEGIQGRGHICEMPRGVMPLGKYLTSKAEAECTLQRVMGLVPMLYLARVGELLIVALLGTPRLGAPHD